MAMLPVGLGLAGAAVMKRRSRAQTVIREGDIRPEFAVMGQIMRPIILFLVCLFAAKMTLFYFLLGGQKFLTPLDYGGILFVLATYAGYLIAATSKQREVPAEAAEPIAPGVESAA
jgi:cation transporter-like permease